MKDIAIENVENLWTVLKHSIIFHYFFMIFDCKMNWKRIIEIIIIIIIDTRMKRFPCIFLVEYYTALLRQESHNGGKNSTLHFVPSTAKRFENTWFCLCFDISCVKLASFWCLDWLAFIKFADFKCQTFFFLVRLSWFEAAIFHKCLI